MINKRREEKRESYKKERERERTIPVRIALSDRFFKSVAYGVINQSFQLLRIVEMKFSN